MLIKVLLTRPRWFKPLALVAGRPALRKGEMHGQRKTCASVEAHWRGSAKGLRLVCLYRGIRKAIQPTFSHSLLVLASELGR